MINGLVEEGAHYWGVDIDFESQGSLPSKGTCRMDDTNSHIGDDRI